MRFIDISWPITENMTAYKNRKIVEIVRIKTFEVDGVRESKMTLGAHTGTHIDAPSHFVEDGNSVETIPLDSTCGLCKVFDLTGMKKKITSEDLQELSIEEGDIILLKTNNSILSDTAKFNPEFVYLDSTGAEYLASKKIKSVGIDYLGIERGQPTHPSHSVLLENNIVIIEGLRLNEAKQGNYTLFCFPLKVVGVEGVPARAVLIG